MTSRRAAVDLVRELPLGEQHDGQMRAVAGALEAILDGRRGVVLADEVGFGKTYEALAVMTLLMQHRRRTRNPVEHVLVLCKPSLISKWSEEISVTRASEGRGFPQYLQDNRWRGVREFLKGAHIINRRYVADDKRAAGLRGTRLDGTIQVPPGFYVVNQNLLSERVRVDRPLLKHLFQTRWDLIIVDEAHHYAKGNQPNLIFAPDGDLQHYDQGISGGAFRNVLALTATPFELTPTEILNLLRLIRAEPQDVDAIGVGLESFVQQLDRLFDHRQRSPDDELRKGLVSKLKSIRLREASALSTGVGLEVLLRRYLIRNTKALQERRYFVVNRLASTSEVEASARYQCEEFRKLDDVQKLVKRSALIPFQGTDALFYLHLRSLIQETTDRAREGEDHATFITTDLRQGLSSYPQVESSALVQRDLASAELLRTVVGRWNRKRGRLHPKVRAVCDIISGIAADEVAKLDSGGTWLSKVLVFNKLIEGTAVQLHEQIQAAIAPIFDRAVDEHARACTVDRRVLADRLRMQVDAVVKATRTTLTHEFADAARVPAEFEHPACQRYAERHDVEPFTSSLRGRVGQPLFLLDALISCDCTDDGALGDWLGRTLLGPWRAALADLCRAIRDARAQSVDEGALERAERDFVALIEDHRSVEVVGRFDGSDPQGREARRRNFNLRHNPFVLLVSRVGEEGIDLQKQCRYVIHYDLEWNPAKMEQREGRVDRVGWGRSDEKFIDVRFLLLKGTYEERMFHTVMQRDQWFQVLIGSKRNQLGRVSELDEDRPDDEEPIAEVDDRGKLTAEECRAIMLDLSPPSL